MPLARPSLSDLRTQARSDMVAKLPSLDGQLRRSLVNAVADVLAGMVFLLYGFLAWLATMLLPDTAAGDWLARWLAIKRIVKFAAVAWQGTVTIGGSIDGTPIPAGTVLTRGDNALFTVNAPVTLASLTATLTVTASAAGADGNCDNATILSLTTAIAGINASGAVGATTVTGVDAELDDAVRVRLLQALQQPASGGTSFDYIRWAGEAGAGVTRAWCFPLEGGDGTVTVRFAVDNASYGPIPHSGDIAAVAAYIATKSPVAAVVTVVAPTANPVNFTIDALAVLPGYTLTGVKANIQAAQKDLFRQAGAPGGTVLLELISDAITRAEGVAGFGLTTPSAGVTSGAHAIPVSGTFTWT